MVLHWAGNRAIGKARETLYATYTYTIDINKQVSILKVSTDAKKKMLLWKETDFLHFSATSNASHMHSYEYKMLTLRADAAFKGKNCFQLTEISTANILLSAEGRYWPSLALVCVQVLQ